MFSVFILMHYQGLGGSLRRSYDPAQYAFTEFTRQLNVPISILGFTAVAGQIVFLLNFFSSLKSGKKAEQNPWQSAGLEWCAQTPVPHGNWGEQLPEVRRWPYQYGPDNGPEDYVPQTAT